MNRKILYTALLLLPLVGCTQKDIFTEADYSVTLDPSNTYIAGDPVVFNLSGNVENILFFSGEDGHEYQYKDRYSVDIDKITKATLNLTVQPRYGAGSLDMWYTTSFSGLNGSDGSADRATLQALEDGGMEGWTKVTIWDADNPETDRQDRTIALDVTGSIRDFCMAFLWDHESATTTQRTYWVNGDVTIDTEQYGSLSTDLSSFAFTVVTMNDELAPYYMNNGNGSVILNQAQDISFQGLSANVVDYPIKAWCVSTPQYINEIPHDEGVVVKNMQEDMLESFTYTFANPGTYKVVFLGRNVNYIGTSELVKEFTITILPEPLTAGE